MIDLVVDDAVSILRDESSAYIDLRGGEVGRSSLISRDVLAIHRLRNWDTSIA